MSHNELIESIRLPRKIAQDAGYDIDWTNEETVRDSISKMDHWTKLTVKCAIDMASFEICGRTNKELKQAGITKDNLLQIASGSNSDA